MNADEVLNDEEYYDKGVSLYERGAFDESFIVFFNLAEKGHNDSIFNLIGVTCFVRKSRGIKEPQQKFLGQKI